MAIYDPVGRATVYKKRRDWGITIFAWIVFGFIVWAAFL